MLTSGFFAAEPPGKPLREVLRVGKTLYSEESSNSSYLVNGAEWKQNATGMWQVSDVFVGVVIWVYTRAKIHQAELNI